jgi:LPXTG-motif cell wall-anchored protein
MTQVQQRQVRWLLLAALPGGVLALGGLVWLRRRK